MNALKRLKGTQDILPEDAYKWAHIENKIRQQMALFNYQEIRTPVFELTELFARGIGALTDIVSKEMYTFTDRSEKSVTLKPEMTASVMRAYHENNLQAQTPLSKLFYITPLFRQERPQAGRLRQFHQFGAEFIGSPAASADAETIVLALSIFKNLGIKNPQLTINTVGDAACREPYKKILQSYLRSAIANPSQEVAQRIDNNPLRLLDSKDTALEDIIRQAPKLVDHLNETSHRHYQTVKDILKVQQVSFKENPTLVRGLDYYTHTVYEVTNSSLGAQNALCGGGRYDLLSKEIAQKDVSAVGFAAGIERILMVLKDQNSEIAPAPALDVFIVALGQAADIETPKWISLLRENGFSTDTDFLQRSVKAQFREANRQQARFVLVLGEDELSKQIFAFKDMHSGKQENIPFAELISQLSALKNVE